MLDKLEDDLFLFDCFIKIFELNFVENDRQKQLKTVKLVSADKIEFELDYNCASQSGTIKDLLESSTSMSCRWLLINSFLLDWIENETGVIDFSNIE